jgi:hypothetical protein
MTNLASRTRFPQSVASDAFPSINPAYQVFVIFVPGMLDRLGRRCLLVKSDDCSVRCRPTGGMGRSLNLLEMLLVNLLTHPVFFPTQSQSTHILVSWQLAPRLFALGKFLSGLCGNDAPDLTLENYFVLAAMVDAGYQF